MKQLFFILGLLTQSLGYANGFPGGHEALVSITTAWIADDQSIDRDWIKVTPPDKRIPVTPCSANLSIRFPFPNNRRTVEVSCNNPSWKRYLRVEIEEQRNAWTFKRDLTQGTQIQSDDITYGQTAGSFAPNSLEPSQIIGRIIRENVSEGDVITQNLLSKEITVYVPVRSYEAGEVIVLEDLSIERHTEDKSLKPVTLWPQQTVIAKSQLNPGKPIESGDIEIAEYVLIAKTTIVNGQVITEDHVESRLEAITSYGPQPLTEIKEIVGLEATRTIRAGQRLNANDFVAADLVRKNETVRLVITRGALEIKVDTIALENAKIGEQVLLKNPDSGKEIRGIVTGRHEARGL
jgi:flagella basal body P-ring formation protein FlgA